MTIAEAVGKITPEWPFIARKAWFFPYDAPTDTTTRIQPMNGPHGCVQHAGNNIVRWTPTAEDLTADDWCLIKDRRTR